MAIVAIILIGIAFLTGFQYSLATQKKQTITREVVVFPEIVYFTSSTCTSGPETTISNTTVYIAPSETPPYYVDKMSNVTVTETRQTSVVTTSESYCFTSPTTTR